MNNQFETAFIPQQPFLKVGGTTRPHEPVSFALVLALIVFFVTIVVAIGVYFYRSQVEARVTEKGMILQAAEKDFSIDEITTYKQIDSRLTLAKKLVDEHTISSAVFDLVESSVAQNVGLTSFSFAKGDQSGKGDFVSLTGEAPSYAAVYFQIEAWRGMRTEIRDLEITGMELGEKSGIVTFSVKLSIDPKYTESLRVLKAKTPEQQTTAVEEQPSGEPSVSPVTNIPLP